MKKLFTLSIFATLLFACQKEVSVEDPNGGQGGGNGTKLVRIGAKTGTDSITIDYTYNSANRIIDYKLMGTQDGTGIDEAITYTRNSANIITKEVYKSSDLARYGLTEVVTNHFHDGNKYTHSITKVTIPGVGSYTDSVVYAYDAANRVASATDWLSQGGAFTQFSKEEYDYTGANVASEKSYDFNSQTSQFDLVESSSFEYDSRINPLSFPSEAIILKTGSRYATFYSANNYVKLTNTSSQGSGTLTRTFTYNGNNMPATGTSLGSKTTALTFYYK